MTCANPDRAQLMCFDRALAITPDALAWGASIIGSPQTTNPSSVRSQPSALSAPVGSTWTGARRAGVLDTLIAARCKGMTFRSDVTRKRFLSVHRHLATYLGRDA